MKTTKILRAAGLLLILIIAISCRSNRSTSGRQYPSTPSAEIPTKTTPVYTDAGNLPPGQAKKVYGGQSAKAYAPGQRKKYANRYPLVIVYSPSIVIKQHSDGRYYHMNTAGYTYWKGYDGRYYIDEKNLKGMEYEVSEYDDWKLKGQKNNKAQESKKEQDQEKVKEDKKTKDTGQTANVREQKGNGQNQKAKDDEQKGNGQNQKAKDDDQKEKDQADQKAKEDKSQKGKAKSKG